MRERVCGSEFESVCVGERKCVGESVWERVETESVGERECVRECVIERV